MTAAGIFFCSFTKTVTSPLYHVIFDKRKQKSIITSWFSTHLLVNNGAPQPVKGSAVRGECSACFKLWGIVNEEIFVKRVFLIRLLIQMRSGIFQKRKPFIGAGTADLVWTVSLCFCYHQKKEKKNWGDSAHDGKRLICVLSTTVMSLFIAV